MDNQLAKHCTGFLQHDSSNQSEIVMIKLYCCGPGDCSRYPLLYYFFQIRNGLGSSVFKLCCKDSAKPCTMVDLADELVYWRDKNWIELRLLLIL